MNLHHILSTPILLDRREDLPQYFPNMGRRRPRSEFSDELLFHVQLTSVRLSMAGDLERAPGREIVKRVKMWSLIGLL